MAPRERRFDEEPRGVFDRMLEPELPDERRSCGVLFLARPCDEPCLAVPGRGGDTLRCLVRTVRRGGVRCQETVPVEGVYVGF